MDQAAPIPVFDGHNDSLLRLYEMGPGAEPTFLEVGAVGHLNLPRARAGGFGGGFFAVYVPPDPQFGPYPDDVIIGDGSYEVPYAAAVEGRYAQRAALGIMAVLYRLEAIAAGQIRVVRTVDEVESCLQSGVLAAALHIEGAEAIDRDLDALEVFYAAGLRSLGIVWSRPNIFGYGVPFKYPFSPDTGPGLTDAGRDLVRACNRLGIMIDLSHLNERGFWDVAELSDAPLVATHTAVWDICPSTRNLTAMQLDAIRASDGMVGLNFSVSDLRPDSALDSDVPFEIMLRHIDYLVEHIGIDRVGIGSDFDGATVPRQIGDAAGLPHLLDALREHGYSPAEVSKIAHENWLRVLRLTWKSSH